MKRQNLLTSMALVALGAVLMGAASSASMGRESRPRLVQENTVVVTVDKVSGAVNPIRYLVLDVDGPWLHVQLLKKKKRDRKGKPFWLKVDDIGSFMVEK